MFLAFFIIFSGVEYITFTKCYNALTELPSNTLVYEHYKHQTDLAADRSLFYGYRAVFMCVVSIVVLFIFKHK
jgi:hypothetical protein